MLHRVHCSLNLNTETGRLSARRPNLQNQPALEKDRYKVRRLTGFAQCLQSLCTTPTSPVVCALTISPGRLYTGIKDFLIT